MFNIGAWEWIVLAVVVLVFVGPEQLPSVIRRTGQLIGQLRSMSEGLRGDFMEGMSEIEAAADPTKWAANAGSIGPKRTPKDDNVSSDELAPASGDWVSTAPKPAPVEVEVPPGDLDDISDDDISDDDISDDDISDDDITDEGSDGPADDDDDEVDHLDDDDIGDAAGGDADEESER